ncbi:MAG: CoA transferase [Dehalococcoidia bacterium]
MAGPLDGVRIIDLSRGIAGPLATMTLSDQGAEVIKVEPPGGDAYRSYGGYTVWNRGKKSVVLDLKDGADSGRFLDLLSTADALVESFSPGVMARLGLDYETVKREFPSLVYCSITGYGRNNRSQGRPGIDGLVQARSGQQYEQAGWRDGPIFLYMPMPSMAASYLAATGVAAALYVRELTGRGQWVETSLYQGVLAFTTQLWQWAEKMDGWFSIPKQAQPTIYQCADGLWVHSMHMAGGRGRDRSALWRILGIDPVENPWQAGPGIDKILRDAFKRIPRQELLEQFWANDIPIQAIQPIADAFRDPQVLHNGMVAEVDDPVVGPTKQAGVTFTLHAAPGKVQGPAPLLGQHTDEVLASLDGARPQPRPRQGRDRPAHALAGVKVVDFGNFLAGPFGPMILSDLGADVIKLESTEGDQMRGNGMPFHGCQRGKRDIAVDLKRSEGREIAHRLIREVDVIHHNFRPGVAERLGIDYETARRLNPRVIYCHTPAYGITGPRASWPGFDQLFQAMCGCEHESGGEGNPPVWYRFGMCDTGNAFQSVIGVLLALYYREKTGKGQFVDTNLLNCGVYYNSDVYIGPDGPFQRPRLDSSQTGLGPLYRLYQTADGWVAIACFNEGQWQALCRAIGRPQMAGDQRFASPQARGDHAKQLASLLEAAFAGKTAQEWFDALDAAGVPCEISDPEAGQAWFTDPDNVKTGLVAEYRHPEYGTMRQFGHLIHFSETPGRIFGPPPLLGQHTREIMMEVGYAAEEMDRLKQAGVVTWPA